MATEKEMMTTRTVAAAAAAAGACCRDEGGREGGELAFRVSRRCSSCWLHESGVPDCDRDGGGGPESKPMELMMLLRLASFCEDIVWLAKASWGSGATLKGRSGSSWMLGA